ncbi:permease [Candidatus Micrarchaeota archaeon]|nr:permease [Candidatus Micrarchaeota archaeon]
MKKFVAILGVFLLFYLLPGQSEWFNVSVVEGLELLNDYAKEHVLTCLVPALFIAGAIGVFIKKDSVLKYLGADANRYLSYGIASVSGAILAVCSCTILPLFAGIRKRGAGLGPAITFLFSGPAINVAAIFLTMSVLGFEIGIARIVFSIILAILIGISMSLIFREKTEKGKLLIQDNETPKISSTITILFFIMMVGILVVNGMQIDFIIKYLIMGALVLGIVLISVFKFEKETRNEWIKETWDFSKKILPLLFAGVFIAGFVMPLLPEQLITEIVGQNTIFANLVASIFGAFMYFSTLTEIPILQALIAKGMHMGPALALLLAGPSLSLPNMLVIRGLMGTKKTAIYILLVVFYSTIAGLLFGHMF